MNGVIVDVAVWLLRGTEVKISSPSCTPSVEVGSTYFIRLTVMAEGSLEYAACDYVISDANGDPTQLTCGKTLSTSTQRPPISRLAIRLPSSIHLFSALSIVEQDSFMLSLRVFASRPFGSAFE